MSAIEIRRLGLLPYSDAWDLQLRLLAERAENKIPDTLLVVEHPNVITLGKRSAEAKANPELKELQGIPVYMVERGGEATYHGPGQVVMYPLFELNLRTGPKAFLRLMEEAIIATLANYGVDSYWIEGKTGVWLKNANGRERKIASLGIAVRRSVSYHGLALNVNNDLSPFHLIQPCGFEPTVMTKLQECLGREVPPGEVVETLAREVCERFVRKRDERRVG
jgi:lipoyl(octanoyl) transferase